jgi:diguanylate cyclase (GGDEF)-like protein/PAS domain S-box-containing protein
MEAVEGALPAGLAAYQSGALLLASIIAVVVALTTFAVYRRRLAAAERRLRELADVAVEGLVTCRDGVIEDANAAFLDLVGLDHGQCIGRELVSFVAPEARQVFATVSERPCDLELSTLDDGRTAVEVAVRELHEAGSLRVYTVQDIRQRRIAEERIRFLALHDPLTGLPNRITLQQRLGERLERAWANDEQLAIFCLDLDRFKEVNDVFGHAAGDTVLVEVTRRIREAVGADDVVARLGGDEFAVLSSCDPMRASALAERLAEWLMDSVAVGERQISVAVSIGIAVFPSHGTTAESLLKNADVALCRAKAPGGPSCCFYNSQMDLVVRERRALANDLALALQAGDLDLHYQPLAQVSSLAVKGFEALVRWKHPTRGFVPPSEFVALAEENGLVHELGLWVLRRACSEAAKWRNPLDIAVNISPLQFHQGDLPEQLLAILIETDLSPTRLELEITETVLITDFDRALSMLRRLKALGLRIAMDDFGTGWSSLSSLQAFPFDKVKIDRIFIDKIGRHKQADVIVRAILGLCRNLGIPVLAEGVETEEQLEFLRREECDDMQGYLLSRPAPIATFSQVVDGDASQPALIKVA